MKGTRKANRGSSFLDFVIKPRQSLGLASNGISYDLTEVVGVPAGVRDYHHILDLCPCVISL